MPQILQMAVPSTKTFKFDTSIVCVNLFLLHFCLKNQFKIPHISRNLGKNGGYFQARCWTRCICRIIKNLIPLGSGGLKSTIKLCRYILFHIYATLHRPSPSSRKFPFDRKIRKHFTADFLCPMLWI